MENDEDLKRRISEMAEQYKDCGLDNGVRLATDLIGVVCDYEEKHGQKLKYMEIIFAVSLVLEMELEESSDILDRPEPPGLKHLRGTLHKLVDVIIAYGKLRQLKQQTSN